jgi:hypothetical protein
MSEPASCSSISKKIPPFQIRTMNHLAVLIDDSIALISKARAWIKSTTSIGPETLGAFAPPTQKYVTGYRMPFGQQDFCVLTSNIRRLASVYSAGSKVFG